MTVRLIQGRAATVDIVLRTDDPARHFPLRAGLGPSDVTCQRKRSGSASWVPMPLDAATWRDSGNGTYLLDLDATDVEAPGALFIFVSGAPGLAPPVLPVLLEAEVVPERHFSGTRPDLPRTILVGQLAGQDGRPLVGATITASLLETPVLLRGAAIAGDAIMARSDDDGFFELPLITGATVDLSIAAARYRRTLVVPPPPAPGVPVRLFSIP